MPRYYCDYCDTYLTHDSPSVRKQHNAGYKHKANVRNYYQQFEEQQTQSLIDQKIKQHLSGQAAFGQIGAQYAAWRGVRPPIPVLPIPGVVPMAPGIRLPVLPRPAGVPVYPATAPIPGQPGAPIPGQPGVPIPGQPGAPIPGQPGAPIPGQPGAPIPGQPGAPISGQPGAPIPGQPGAPSAPVQTNGPPGPPPAVNTPTSVPGSTPPGPGAAPTTASQPMYPGMQVSGGFGGANVPPPSSFPSANAGYPPTSSSDSFAYSQASNTSH